MTVRQVAQERNRLQAAVARQAAATAERVWNATPLGELEPAWAEARGTVVNAVTAGQLLVAATAQRYVTDALTEQGATPRPAATVQPGRLAGVASDGRPLDTLLASPVIVTRAAQAGGLTAQEAKAAGLHRLVSLVSTQVQDAARVATSVAMAADPTVTGYRRQLTPPSCARCVILAGRFYRINTGFLRHPRCDCVHVPAVGPSSDLDGLATFDPRAYFDSLDAVEQARTFTKAGAQAIRDGADIAQVVNARRGMRTSVAYGRTIRTTSVGARRLGRRRLMPEQIYEDARDRAHAVELLRRFGYLA